MTTSTDVAGHVRTRVAGIAPGAGDGLRRAAAGPIAVAVAGPPGPSRDEACRMLAGCPLVAGPPLASSVRAVAGWPVALVVLCSPAPVEDVRLLVEGSSRPPAVLVLSAVVDDEQVVAALRAGASSYLIEGQFTSAEMISAVLGTGVGLSHLSPRALTAVVRRLQAPPADGAPAEVRATLSRREREIMELVAAGHSTASIAAVLFLAEKTVRNHLNNIYGKLGVRSRAEALVTWLGRIPVQPARARLRVSGPGRPQ